MISKVCSVCQVDFTCGSETATGGCWCDSFPPLDIVEEGKDCMCPTCLKAQLAEEIKSYTNTPRTAAGKRANLPQQRSQGNQADYYMENGLLVFTEQYHLKRGSCCKS